MLKFENSFKNDFLIEENLRNSLPFPLSQTIFFDIETTGFTAKNSNIYLIGCMYFMEETNSFHLVQFFQADGEEGILLCSFFEFIKPYKYLVHFNGNGFDIPFILQKCTANQLLYDFSAMIGFDLYREACKYKHYLPIGNLKQKTLEEFFGLQRTDLYTGGELINVYYDYQKSREKNLLNLLLLHNSEDIRGMLTILKIYHYTSVFDGNFSIQNVSINSFAGYNDTIRKELLVECTLKNIVSKRISGGNEIYYFSISGNILKLKVLIRNGELKFFYPDYKNYYYLPNEDCAIHKSVAFYVDKNFRTQAKAANCYSRKTGNFLPEEGEIICPYFKAEYNDSVMYFEADNTFLKDKDKVKSYVLHILQLLLQRKKLPV